MKVSDKKWDRSSQWLLMEKNPKTHMMPFCSLPRDVACVWHALIRGFLNWHQAVPFWIGDVTVVEKPELWRWLRCQDHLLTSPLFFIGLRGFKTRMLWFSPLFSPTSSYPSSQNTCPCLPPFSRLRTPVLTQHREEGGREGGTAAAQTQVALHCHSC